MSLLTDWIAYLLWIWRHGYRAHGFTVAFGSERDIPRNKETT